MPGKDPTDAVNAEPGSAGTGVGGNPPENTEPRGDGVEGRPDAGPATESADVGGDVANRGEIAPQGAGVCEAPEHSPRYFAGLRALAKQRRVESEELFNRSIPYREALTLAGPKSFGVHWLPLSPQDDVVLRIGLTHPDHSEAFRHYQEHQDQIQWLNRLFLKHGLMVERAPGGARVLQRELEAVLDQQSSNNATLQFISSPSRTPIEQSPPTPTAPSHVSRKRGPLPLKRENTKRAMLADLRCGKTNPLRLKQDTEEVLSTTYAVSRETCRLARDAALAEFSNPDK